MAYSEEFNEITIPAFKRIWVRSTEASLVISVADWDSLLERVKACKPSFPFWTATYSVAFGIGITAGLSILPIAFAPQMPGWVFTAYVTTSAVGFAAGILSVIAERAASRRQQSGIDRLVVELERRKSLAVETGGG